MNTSDDKTVQAEAAEAEFYVEPPRMSGRDAAGVVVALVALAIIGLSGYVWLNPDLSMRTLLARQPAVAPAATSQPAAGSEMPGMDMTDAGSPAGSEMPDMQSTTAAAPAAGETAAPSAGNSSADSSPAAAGTTPAPAAAAGPIICDQCGMFADRSQSYVIAKWDDGSLSHHDSWDCVFKYGQAIGKSLAGAQALAYGSKDTSSLLDAAGAWFLYGTTKTVKNSMPPYVAAYSDKAAAQSAQADMGGELVDFAGLKAKWS